ncbi:superinfection immunity protein [Pseudomonas extremaustralis]|uniref:superinfection immunity protein n=1 Tax=Pseudomonas extremaustralis TaxID=359110 RepID=UPI001239AA15|nr:superinfection immunity protein [Pseudomonas extremaustralis]
MNCFGLVLLIFLCAISYLCKSGDNFVAITAQFLFGSSAVGLYFYPSICSIGKPKRIRNSILKLNLLAGWTGIGWFVAQYRVSVLPLTDE